MFYGKEEEPTWKRDARDVFEVFRLSGPMVLVLVGIFATQPLTTVYLSRMFAEGLATANLANLTGNLIGRSLVKGILSGLDTLAPQAMGSKHYGEVGDITVLACAAGLVLSLFILPVWLLSPTILTAMGQPARIAGCAGEFLQTYSFSLPAMVVFNALQKFLSCQGVVFPLVPIIFVSIGCQFLYLHLCVSVAGLGYRGAGLAQGMTWYTMTGLTLLYMYVKAPHDPRTWPGFRKSAFETDKVKAYLKLSIPGIFTYAEWWYWEVISFFAGWISEADASAHAAAFLLLPVYYLTSLAVGLGLNIRVGQLLGSGAVGTARRLTRLCMILGLFLHLAGAAINQSASSIIISWATSDPVVIEKAKSIWIGVTFTAFFNSMFAVQGSLCRAIGDHSRLAVAVLVTLWILGLPGTALITFTFGLDLGGIWIGMPVSQGLLAISTFVIHRLRDWEAISNQITNRVNTAAIQLQIMGDDPCRLDPDDDVNYDVMASTVGDLNGTTTIPQFCFS